MNQLSPSRLADCRVLVVGDVMLDRYWFGEVARISPEAPVPVVHVQREHNRPGGAANVAFNIRSFGAKVTLLSVVGADAVAKSLREIVQSTGISALLCEAPSMETTVKLRVIGLSQQMLRIDFERKPAYEELEALYSHYCSLIDCHDIVIFSDYGKGSLSTNLPEMINLARKRGLHVLVDPKGTDWSRYRSASVITPNRAELADLVGWWTSEAQLYEKAQMLRGSLGIQALLLTRSEEGMTLFEAGCASSVQAQTREVVDVTGAGDTVIATMALMLACGMSLTKAMDLANRAAGLVVAKLGTSTITLDELMG